MTEIYQVTNVQDGLVDGTECWFVDSVRQSDGGTHRHAMPKSIVEWRAAEYGLDHTTASGRQQIIDLVVHEPFMPPIPFEVLQRNAKGNRLATDEVHLYNASTRDAARAAHLAKLSVTKASIAQVNWPQSGVTTLQAQGSVSTLSPLLQKMIDHVPDPASVDEKTKLVIAMRADLGLS